MADAHKNFAYSTVLTAPSPATSGTSLVVASGDGAKFPAVPFNATVWPVSAQPITTNAEIVRVTARSTDTLTITRAQESTSARTIVVGDQIAATITAKTLTDIETTEMRWQGAFDPATNYLLNDVVSYQGKIYLNKLAVTVSSPTYVGSSSAISNPSTVALPAGSLAGDLVIISIQDYTGGSAVKPTYATLIGQTFNSGVSAGIFSSYTLLTADITAGTLTIPGQTGPDGAVDIHVFRGVRATTDVFATTATLSTAVVTPSDACFLLEVGNGLQSTSSGAVTASWSPSGFRATASSNNVYIGVGYEELAAGVSSTSRTFTNANNINANTFVVAILKGLAFNTVNWTDLAVPAASERASNFLLMGA